MLAAFSAGIRVKAARLLAEKPDPVNGEPSLRWGVGLWSCRAGCEVRGGHRPRSPCVALLSHQGPPLSLSIPVPRWAPISFPVVCCKEFDS